MISVVIPVFNEQDSIRELHQRLVSVFTKFGRPAEFIFVNDGSTDQSANILQGLSPASIVHLRRNFGQTAALAAGVANSQGDLIVTLDADLQNPPEEIPKLIEHLEQQKLDLVSGWRTQRQDPAFKRLASRGANVLRHLFIRDGIHDSGCTLKVYRRHCFDHLELLGEMHRFVPGILKWQGFQVGELPVAHVARQHGESKYNTWRIVKGFIDMLGVWFWRSYSARPLHLFGGTGLILTVLGILLLAVLAIARIVWLYPLSNSIWPLVATLCLLAGLQLFVSGILAEIMIKQYYRGDNKPYSIKTIQRQ